MRLKDFFGMCAVLANSFTIILLQKLIDTQDIQLAIPLLPIALGIGGSLIGKGIGSLFGGGKDDKNSAPASGILQNILQTGQGIPPAIRSQLLSGILGTVGRQAEAAGAGLSRRQAAQGIGNTGLAGAGFGRLQNALLSATQQAGQGLAQADLNIFQKALFSLFAEEAQRRTEKSSKAGVGDLAALLLAEFAGPFVEMGGQALGKSVFEKKPKPVS